MSRPYDRQRHRRIRRELAPRIAAGGVTCWRCEKANPGAPENEILPGTPWDLGHDDENPDEYAGPEHATCNRSAGARKRDAKNALTRLGTRSREW